MMKRNWFIERGSREKFKEASYFIRGDRRRNKNDEEFESHLDKSMNTEVNINHKLAILNEFMTKKESATVSRLP